jgi:hypothetical protein
LVVVGFVVGVDDVLVDLLEVVGNVAAVVVVAGIVVDGEAVVVEVSFVVGIGAAHIDAAMVPLVVA